MIKAMNIFLNFDVNNGVSLTNTPIPSAVGCGDDFEDWVNDVSKSEYDSCVSVENLSDCISLLEDNAYWNNSNVTSEDLESLHCSLAYINELRNY